MVYTPDYTLTVDGVAVHFLFRSLTFKKYTTRKRIELDDFKLILYKTVTEDKERTVDTSSVRRLRPDDYADLLLAGHEAYCAYHRITFTADETDAYAWLDQMGGILFCDGEMFKVLAVCVANLFHVDTSSVTVSRAPEDDKKKEAANGLPGSDSTSLVAQPV